VRETRLPLVGSFMDEVGSVFVETVDLIPSRVSFAMVKDFINL